MMDSKELIKLNNEKRKQLTKENVKYYDQMLLYIRSHLILSEQQTEEILMELLDHLLEAQNNGKTVEDVFGKDLKSYCDELIRQLPKEKGKTSFTFITYLITMIAGIMIMISGLANIITGFFKKFDQTFFLGTTIVGFVIQVLMIFLFVYIVFSWIKWSAFKENLNKIVEFLIIFLLSSLAFFCIIFIPKWIPPFGVEFEISGYVMIIIGLIILFISKWINIKFRLTR